MKKSFKPISASKPTAVGQKTPSANWQDDKFIYCCQNLITCCTSALREGVEAIGPEVAEACSTAIVCANVAVSCFTYFDEASLSERIGACNELSACCQLLVEALGAAEFDGSKNCLDAAQSCCDLCALTAGTEEENAEAAPAETADMTAPAAAAAKKPVAKLNPNWLKVVAKADGYEMSVNGFIGASVEDDSGVSGKEFAEALAKIPKGKHVNLRINSEGGSVADGLQIYNLLKDRRPDVTSYIDGVALSCASLIALAAEKVVSPISSVWMIHAPRLATYGDTEEHKKSIKMLKTFTDMMADVYSEETGKSKDEVLSDMESETWLTGSEAVDYGLATATDEEDDDFEDQSQEPDQDADAHYRSHAVLAMYRPPERVRQIISASKSADGKTNVGHAASTTQKEKEVMEKANTPVAADQTASLLEAVNRERKARITAEVNRRAEGKVTNSNLDWWVSQAMAAATTEAEQAIFKQLDDMPKAVAPGGAALRPDKADVDASSTPVFELPVAQGAAPRINKPLPWMEDIRKIKNRAERIQARGRDWGAKLQYCYDLEARESKGGLPVAANTYSATLITDQLVDQAVTILVGRFAALSSFAIEFGAERTREYATGQVKLVTSAGSTQRGTKSAPITNFELGDATVVPVSVPMIHYVKSFNVSQEDMLSGLRIENLMQLNLLQFTKDITLDALQPLAAGSTSTNQPGPLNSSGNVAAFSAGTIHINAGTFGWNTGQTDGHDLASLWAYLKNSPEKNLILDGNFYARLTNSPGFYQPSFNDERGGGGDEVKTFGWDRIEENTVWPAVTDAAGNAVGGLCSNRQAIIGITGLPMTPPNIPGGTLTETVITLPNGLSVSMFTWFALQSRKIWNSFEVMGGFAGGDASAAAVIFNGKGSVS